MEGRFSVPGIGYIPDISALPDGLPDPLRDFPGDLFGLKGPHSPETGFINAAGQAVAIADAVNQTVVDGYGAFRSHLFFIGTQASSRAQPSDYADLKDIKSLFHVAGMICVYLRSSASNRIKKILSAT